MHLQMNGMNLYVERAGRGAALIMLHGLGGNTVSISSDIDDFSRNYTVIAIDARGHGQSDRPSSYTMSDHVSDILGVADEFGVDTFYLLGSSMGSYLAQAVAITAPQRVTKLVLVAPKAHGKSSSSARFFAEHADEVRGLTPQEQALFLRERILAPTTPEKKQAILDERTRTAGIVLSDVEKAAANGALKDFDFRPGLPKVTAATLIISGRHDPMNPPEMGREIANLIPNSTFEVFEHSGHMPRFEERPHYLQVVGDFLAQ